MDLMSELVFLVSVIILLVRACRFEYQVVNRPEDSEGLLRLAVVMRCGLRVVS